MPGATPANPFFNAHHSPMGAFASFTLGHPGSTGGFGLELGRPAEHPVFIGAESREDPNRFEALPFLDVQAAEEERRRYEVESGGDADAPPAQEEGMPPAPTAGIAPWARESIRREFGVATDRWIAGDVTFEILSPVFRIPDPDRADADIDALRLAVAPVVLAELTLDNRSGASSRRAFFGFTSSDVTRTLRPLEPDDLAASACGVGLAGRMVGLGVGRSLGIATDYPGAYVGQGFTLGEVLRPRHEENLGFMLPPVGAIAFDVPAGEVGKARFAIGFFREMESLP
jgi:hypothetical protein